MSAVDCVWTWNHYAELAHQDSQLAVVDTDPDCVQGLTNGDLKVMPFIAEINF